MRRMMGPDAPDFGAASDGDGDRNLIIGKGIFVTPSDSLAILAANAQLAPGYRRASRASPGRCRPAALPTGLPPRSASRCYETPTGWKFFGNLLDAGHGDHMRRGERRHRIRTTSARRTDCGPCCSGSISSRRASMSVKQLVAEHWVRFGRNYYARHDYEAIETRPRRWPDDGNCGRGCPAWPATRSHGLKVSAADDFAYVDPVDGAESRNQGVRILFEGGSRIVFRLSGTGTEGATLRVYLERYEAPGGELGAHVGEMLEPLARAARDIADISRHTGRTAPNVVA